MECPLKTGFTVLKKNWCKNGHKTKVIKENVKKFDGQI